MDLLFRGIYARIEKILALSLNEECKMKNYDETPKGVSTFYIQEAEFL